MLYAFVFFRSVFPNGLSGEYSLVTILRVRKTTKKDRWYLWQIFDLSGGAEVGPTVCCNIMYQFQYIHKMKRWICVF